VDICRRLAIFPLIIAVLWAIQLPYSFAGSRSYSYEEKLLLHINQHRTVKGLNPLAMDKSLSRLAERHSAYMEEKNVLSHEGFQERFRQSDRSQCVENVGWNYQTPEDQFRAWKTSGEHNKNLLNNKITHAGIAKTGSYVTFFACTGEE
jgi:uncharacterized protein YkwD